MVRLAAADAQNRYQFNCINLITLSLGVTMISMGGCPFHPILDMDQLALAMVDSLEVCLSLIENYC